MNRTHFLLFFMFLSLTRYTVRAQETPRQKSENFSGKDTIVHILNLINTPLTEQQDYVANVYFQEALKAFDAKKYEETGIMMRTGVQDLLREAPRQHDRIKNHLVEQRVGEILALSLQVEAGLIDNRAILQDLFAKAHESVAQRYYDHINLLNGTHAEAIANRLLCMSVHLRNSEEYRTNAADKAALVRAADDAAGLGADIRDMKSKENLLTPELKARLYQLMTAVREMRLDE